MWSHAPLRRVSSPISTRGSHAPVFTFPACAHTIVGPEVAESHHSRASGRIRPCASVATPMIVRLPTPVVRLAAPIDECASSPATSVSRGAPCSPIASTSHRARRSISCRAAASAVMLAAWAPVTNPTLDSGGRPSASRIQRAVHDLERRHPRRHHLKGRVLIPGRHEPVHRQCHGMASPGHEPEVARTGRGRQARLEGFTEVSHDGRGVLGRVGKTPAERVGKFFERRPRAGWPVGQGFEKPRGALVGVRQQVVQVGHRRMHWSYRQRATSAGVPALFSTDCPRAFEYHRAQNGSSRRHEAHVRWQGAARSRNFR